MESTQSVSFNRMADGRSFTDYRPNCTKAGPSSISKDAKSSYDQRQHMIKNANKIMQDNLNMCISGSKIPSSYSTTEDGTMLPEKNMMSCNETTCTFSPNDVEGIGTGRNYHSFK